MSNYKLCFCTDFFSDIVPRAFNLEDLRILFSTMRDWGMTRCYWIYTMRFAEGMYDYLPRKNHSKHAALTYQAIGEYLDAAVNTAHELDLEIYAVYKPFDLGFGIHTFPFETLEAEQYGKLDSLGGKHSWMLKSLLKNQEKRLTRHPHDLQQNYGNIASIEITFGSRLNTVISIDDFDIIVSSDNVLTKTLKKDYSFTMHLEGGNTIIRIGNVNIIERYIILKYVGEQRIKEMGNTLDMLVRLYDANDSEIPYTFSLVYGKDHPHTPGNKQLFMDYTNRAINDHFLEREYFTFNEKDKYIIMAIGKEKYIAGMLSPAYEESHQVWLEHIRQCLDAGVDGIDLRVANHNRNTEFERYGFEHPIVEEYRKRYGNDIIEGEFDDQLRRQIIGELFTEFYRKASALIRSRHKKVQIHIGSYLMSRKRGECYNNIHWEWEKWLGENLADAVTIKGGAKPNQALCDAVEPFMSSSGLSVFQSPYLPSIFEQADWANLLLESMDYSKGIGQSGYIFYETANLLKLGAHHTFDLLYPEFPQIISQFN